MKSSRSSRIALGLIVVPIVVAIGLGFFGTKPFQAHIEGPLLHPTSVSLNAENSGLVLAVLILVGLVWLVVLGVRRLFSRDPHE